LRTADFRDALEALAAGLDRLASEMRLVADRSEDDRRVVARRAEAAADGLQRWQAGRVAQTTRPTTGSAGWT
jgi:hypothetical protein